MHILGGYTTSGFCFCYRDSLDLNMRCGFVKMHIKTDDVFCSPSVTCPMVGVHCPVLDALLQHDMGIAFLKGKVHILVTEGESGQHIMVTADNNADGAVWTVVGDSQGIVFIFIGLETKFVKTLL